MGACSLPLLPVGLELAVEVTRNADASSALLFFGANALGAIFLGVENALREGPEASPPLNMKKALIFQGVIILTVCLSVFGLRGEQTRRKRDAAAVDGDDMQMHQTGELGQSPV
jgi:MFS transporter, FLVCR family, MFS-domain-containing protein 7